MGAASSIMEGRASSNAAEYNAAIADREAKVNDAQAVDAIERGEQEESRHRQKMSILKGQQRATQGASGFLVDSGSALDVLADTAEQAELDALAIRRNAELEAWGYRTGALAKRDEANLERYKSGQYRTSGMISAGSTLLGGAESSLAKYRQYKE